MPKLADSFERKANTSHTEIEVVSRGRWCGEAVVLGGCDVLLAGPCWMS